MGYLELDLDDQNSKDKFDAVLSRENAVKLIVWGIDQEDIAGRAKDVASEMPSNWWVVWLKNEQLLVSFGFLTNVELQNYTNDNIVAVTLRTNNELSEALKRNYLSSKVEIRIAFSDAQ